eukprot:5305559-Pleurochrysis_carterae.AAC.1
MIAAAAPMSTDETSATLYRPDPHRPTGRWLRGRGGTSAWVWSWDESAATVDRWIEKRRGQRKKIEEDKDRKTKRTRIK